MTTAVPKTPPKGTSEGPILQSTPQSRGTSSDAPFNKDQRACRLDNIRLGGIDLEGMQTIEFVSMLKALLARMLLGVSTDGKDTVALDRAKSDANQLFDKMLKDAIGFCNSSLTTSAKISPRSKLSQEMKTNLKEFFRRNSETRRYLLSTAINTIMLAYDGHHFGQLPCLNGDDRIIVIPNDPLVIESKKIKRDLPNAKCKPDNIFIQLSHLLKLKLDDRCEDFDYRAWVESIETECKESKRVRRDADEKTSWLEVHCSLESEARRVIECAPLDQPMSEKQVLGGSTFLVQLPILVSVLALLAASSTPACDVLQFNDSKSESDRRLTSQASGSSTGAASEKKRSHAEAVGSEYASETTSSQKKRKTSDLDERFTAETQCAYYAIERLRAAWNVTHSIVVLLDDNMLSIHWYDSEGCIVTQSIDIIRQLPLFVVLVIILQRFDTAMWGLPDIQTSQTTENGRVSFELDKAKRSCFQLAGRRTFGACAWPRADDTKITPDGTETSGGAATSPVLDGSEQSMAGQGLHDAPITTSTPPPMMRPIQQCRRLKTSSTVPYQGSRASPGSTRGPQSLFFKAAWPENSRDREPDIIAEAISRANKYLDKFKPYVLEHIPTVVSSQEVKHTSTGIIRLLLGLSAERSRTLLWMVCHKLDRIEEFYKLPEEDKAPAFWKAFWELIRCHYLLWRIGIAHGDISVGNLMYNAVTKKAILNDFDLAAVMKPGDISPQKKGFERTGTRPFMALELLRKANGEVRRRYWHDLESFAWCLLWCVMAEDFPREAIHGSLTDVYVYKFVMADDVRAKTAKSGFQSIWNCVVEWVHALVVGPSKDEELRKFVQKLIAGGAQIPSDNPWLTRVLRSKDEDEDRNSVKELIALVDEHGPKIPLDDPRLDWVEFQVPRQASSPSMDANVGI